MGWVGGELVSRIWRFPWKLLKGFKKKQNKNRKGQARVAGAKSKAVLGMWVFFHKAKRSQGKVLHGGVTGRHLHSAEVSLYRGSRTRRKTESVYGSHPGGDVVTGTRWQQGSWREENTFEITSGTGPFVRGGEEKDSSIFSDPKTKCSQTFPLEVKLSHRIRTMMWPFRCEGDATFTQTYFKDKTKTVIEKALSRWGKNYFFLNPASKPTKSLNVL